MARTLSNEGAKKKAWAAFSRFIRNRDPLCITCGNPATQAGHFLHNSDKKNKQLGGNELWYDEQNVHGQCSQCNLFKSGNLGIYSVKLIEKYGPDIIPSLYKKFRTPKKYTVADLLAIEAKYTMEV